VVVCLLAEEFVVDRGLVKMMDSELWLRFRPKKEKYLFVERDMIRDKNWPPLKCGATAPT